MPFDPVADYDEYVDGKPRFDGVRVVPRRRAGSSCPRETPDDPPDAETVDGLGNRKNELVLAMIDEDGVEAYEGSVRYVRAARDAGLRRAVVSSSAQLPRGAGGGRASTTCSRRGSTAIVAEREHLQGKPAPDTFLAAARALGVDARAGRGLRGRARRGRRRPRGRLRLRRRRRPRRPGRRRCASTAPTSSSPTSPSCSTAVIAASGVHRRAVGGARDRARPRPARPDRVGLRALQRPHRPARQPRRGRAASALPGTYLNSFYELRPLPYAEAGYGYPEAGQTVVNVTNGKIIRLLVDDEPFDVRYGAAARSHERALDLRAGRAAPRRATGARRPARRCGSPRRGSSRSSSARSRRSSTRSSRSTTPAARRRPVGARRQRAGAAVVGRTRAPPRRSSRRCAPSSSSDHDAARRARPLDRGERAADGRRHGPRRRRARGHRDRRGESASRPRPGDDRRRPRARRAARGGQVPRLRLVEPALGAGAARPGRRRAGRGPAHGLGRAGRRPARLPRRLLGARRRRARRRRRAAAGGPLRALPHAAGGRPRRAARDPGEGPDRPGLRRPHLLGHRALRAAGAHLHRAATPPRDALRWRHATLELARERARQLGLEGAAFPWRTIRGQECSGYWPAGHRRLPRQRRHRRRRRAATSAATDDDGVRARGRPRAAGRDGAAVALARPPRRRRAASASTASPAPTSTARSPTTTSTRTCWPSGTCARPPTRSRATRATPPSSAPTSRRRPPGATPPATWSSPGTRRSASTRSRRASPTTSAGTSRARAPDQYPLLLHFPYFDLYRKQVVKQADLVLAMHVLRRRVHRRGEGAQLRLLRGAHRPRLLALGLHPGGDRGRGRPPRARLRLLRRGRADGPRTTSSTTRATASTSPRSPAPGSPPSPASAACATTAASCRSLPASLRGSTASPSGSSSAGDG